MKKIIILVSIVCLLPFFSNAQSVEVTPFGGYVFGATLNSDMGDVQFKGSGQYGGMISIAANRVIDVDLLYNRMDTKADANLYYNGYGAYEKEVPISINYMHVGFTKNFRINPKVSPFVGLNFGACLFYPKEDYPETWFFSMGMNGGAKIYFSERIGIKLQAQMMIPYQGGGYTMYFGTGGYGSGVSFYTTMVQFGFTGGLIFRLGKVLY
jgi:hypothetical protein